MNKIIRGFIIYGLIDPRTSKICYIGCTQQLLSNRLRQHNLPVLSNKSKIAKLSRKLKKLKLKLSIVELKRCRDLEDMYLSEINLIKEFRNNGYKIYNLQNGGLSGKNPKESYKKSLKTSIKKGTNLKPKKGSENSSSVLNEDDVLHIYSLIKKYYSNNEIFELYKNKCKISTIKALRTGQNWSHMFKENFDKPIESLKCEKTGYNTRVKLKIVDLIFMNILFRVYS